MISQDNNPQQPIAVPNPADDTDVSIRITDISKMYRIYNRPPDRLKEMLLGGFGRHYGREFWALHNLSFELRRGESLAIIGRNGSGKSTLLQMIAGTLAPTTGQIQVQGRLAALLELGGGFNPQFTGRENVFLKGAILGVSRQEIARRFDEIAAFADIGDFIEQPVRLYSSGMYIRLAFAVATCIDPDVLLVDEALAVGDVFFRQKCYRRLDEMRERGMSLILVTHAMSDVEQFCQRAILLNQGHTLFDGPSSEAVKRYYLIEQQGRQLTTDESKALPTGDSFDEGVFHDEEGDFWPEPEAFLDISNVPQVSNGSAHCVRVALCDSYGRASRVFEQGETATFFYEFEVSQRIEVPIGGIVIQNDKGIIVHGKNTLQYDSQVPTFVPQGSRVRFRQQIRLDIAIGEYTFEPGFATLSRYDYEFRSIYSNQELHAKTIRLCHLPTAAQFIVQFSKKALPGHLLHHGVANLPGNCQVMIANHEAIQDAISVY